MSLSVKKGLQCIGKSDGTSIVHDLFCYTEVPREISLRKQLEALTRKHYHINVINVVPENFPDGSFKKINMALDITREIYGKVDFGIGRIKWFHITDAEADNHEVIDSEGDAEGLTEEWTVPGSALDLFVVRKMNGADGWSAVNGSCDKDSKGMTGSVVSLNGSDANIGNTFAHEMGHYLGLNHISDADNFIGNDGASNSHTNIKTSQGDKMKKHCFVKGGCSL